MDDNLSQRFHSAEDDFLNAMANGIDALSSYHQTWSTLPDVLCAASRTGTVDQKTLSLVHSIASHVANLADCFIDITHGEEFYTTSLQSDCDALLHRMAVLDLNTRPKLSRTDKGDDLRRPHSDTVNYNVEGSSSAFLASAHQWLMNNLHNPYPTIEIKARIAAAASCQVSSVNSWFINARRRIGWTTLCRERFSNCRADMIDAARRALTEDDPQRMLSPDLRHSFVTMKVAAENLYPCSFTRSSFVGGPDAMVKDVTTERKEFSEAEEHCQAKGINFVEKPSWDPYPSPDRSVAASPVPALDDSPTDESEEEEDVSPPIIAGRKRRRSSIEPAGQPPTVGRTIKRLRTSMTSQTYLPSPSASTDGVDVPSYDGSPESVSLHCMRPELKGVPPSHRGHLSDADNTGTLKQPRAFMIAPLSISDPLPNPSVGIECSIDDWFNTDFDALFAIPPPVDATEPEFSSSWEVELFRDYNLPGNPKHTLRCLPVITADPQASAGSDLSELDSLLQSIAGDSSEIVPSPRPYPLSLDLSMPDISSGDWTSLPSGPDVYQAHIHCISSQYPTHAQSLLETDLSTLQIPCVIPSVSSRADSTLKQEKLHQLHVMQEAVRQMVQELESEGVMT